jgi:hypothetical protein
MYLRLRLWRIIKNDNYVGEQRAQFTDTAIVCANGSGRYYMFLLAIADTAAFLIPMAIGVKRSSRKTVGNAEMKRHYSQGRPELPRLRTNLQCKRPNSPHEAAPLRLRLP